MGVFGAVTARRVVAAELADAPPSTHHRSDGAIQQIAMLDVDEINDIRNRRLHALGMAAAGDREAPDERTIHAAQAAQAHGIVLDGEPVATVGNVVVITRGGIAGWLKRNRGKKADPETLAWLRGEEAAEGRAAYAGWADRDDANILEWVRDQRRAGAAQPTGPTRSSPAEVAALREAGVPASLSQAQAGPATGSADPRSAHPRAEPGAAHATGGVGVRLASAAGPCVQGGRATDPVGRRADGAHAEGQGDAHADASEHAQDDGSGDPCAGRAHAGIQGDARGAGGEPLATAHAPDHAGARSPAVQGLDRIALGGAALTALPPPAAVGPSASEVASVRDRLRSVTSTGAVTISVRDHRIALVLVCDQLFEQKRPELSPEGAWVVRELGGLLAGGRGHAYRISVDRERAFELVSNLAIAGLAPERIEIALKEVDRAIDIIEVEWIAVKDTP